MAEPTELEKLRAAERRLALLALSGEQPEPDRPCLRAEQLAALVEGQLPPAEVEAYLAHVSACEHCYWEWRQLDREWQKQGEKSRRTTLSRFISQPRFLTAAGSLLAAAASIAVFLTLTTRIDRTTLTRLPEKSAQEQLVPAPEPPQPAAPEQAKTSVPAPAPPPASRLQAPQADALTNRHELERKKEARSGRTEFKGGGPERAVQPGEEKAKAARRDEQALPAPAVAAAPVAQGDQAGSATTEQKGDDSIGDTTSAAGKAASALPRTTLRATAPQATTATIAETALLTPDDWRSRIRQGCQARPGPEFFAVLTRQGQQLLRESVTLTTQDRLQIERLLAALGKEQPADQLCRVLLELVDPTVQGQGR